MEMLNYRHKKFDKRQRTAAVTVEFKAELIDNTYSDEPSSSSKHSERLDHNYYATSDSSLAYNSDCSEQTCFGATNLSSAKKRHLEVHPSDTNSYFSPKRLKYEDTRSFGSNTPRPSKSSTPLPTTPPPTAAILSKISDDTLRNICKYHGNMVRKFPKKERSPKDQERRNKNTLACRMSRRVKKLEHIAIEEQYKEFSKQHMEIVEQSMRAAGYLNELMKLAAITDQGSNHAFNMLELKETDSNDLDEDDDISVDDHEPLHFINDGAHKKHKSFSIAYLMGD